MDRQTNYQQKYDQLAGKVKTMLAAHKGYFRSRDPQQLRTFKALEKEVDELLNPKPAPSNQAQIDWLGM